MRNQIFSVILLFSFTAFFGCGSKEEKITDDIIPVKIVELKKEPVQKAINVSGVFTTDDETYLSFKTGGIIKSIYVNEGDLIKKDQLLASLELNEIQAQVSQASAGYDKALRDFKRVQNLFKDSAATQRQMDDAQTGLDVAREQLTIAKYNLSHSEIHAPDDGYVLKKFVNEGQLIGPGAPVFQTNGASKGSWLLKAGISDHDWALIKVGCKAVVQSDVEPSRNIDAFVLRKSKGVDPATGTFSVDLKLTGSSSGQAASGLFGKAKIFPENSSKMWSVPYQSILDADGNSGYVFITNDLKKADKIKINIFDLDKDNVYVDRGLESCKYLIVSGTAYLNDGSQIKIDDTSHRSTDY
ncbi:MAG TPA: efflux RND transporter periplasmic adaptor subunit [Ignavibacteriaceae bacterium]|nr:efflux RND transporter periplasmic adaptor subunit [Ignavibacteriaceae bacterium]